MSGQYLPSLNAQYGNIMVDANDLAYVRGYGMYNPPPNYDQTTNRGPAYSQSANFYIDHPEDRPNLPQLPAAPLPDYQSQLDQWNNQPYQVGNTGIHPEPSGSWKSPNIDGNPTRYEEFAARASHLDPNSLMSFFFSPENVDFLQQRIIDEVRRIRKINISRQSDDELLIIMNNFYQKALSGWLPHTDSAGKITDESKRLAYPRGDCATCSLEERLERLNQATLEECVKQVLSASSMYLQYYSDASSLPLPLTLPTYTSMKGSRELSEPVGLYDNPHQATRAIQSFNQRNNII